jgi:hypothetical protein
MIDRALRLLQEREQNYQQALQIGRNQALDKERHLNRLKVAFQQDGTLVEGLDDYISNKISQTRRARRDIVSEGSYMFENDLLNNALGTQPTDLIADVNTTESAARKVSQPIPGTEAHHPASVSSTEALVQNMDEFEVRSLWDIAKKNGYVVGSEAEGFIPLSKPAHTTGGKNWGNDYAHVGKDGQPDPGRFKTEPLPKGTTAADAWKVLQPILDEQRTLNERAYNHPTEALMRQRAQEAFGGEIKWDAKGDKAALVAQNAQAKAKGINATTISKNLDRFPGMQKTGGIPNVTVAVPGARVPLGMGKPTSKPAIPPVVAVAEAKAATQYGVPVRPVGSQATLNGKAVVWNGKKWVNVLPNRLTNSSNTRRSSTPNTNKSSLKANTKPARGTANVRLSDVTPPSQERFGPGGMMSTIDALHERQFQWRR